MRVTGEIPFQEPRLERWYVDLYLTELEQSLGDYIARLAYAEDWTWFDASGNALSDSEVAAMTDADRAEAFISGSYAKGSTGSTSGGMQGGSGGDSAGGPPEMSDDSACGPPDMGSGGPSDDNAGGPPDMNGGSTEEVGTPDSGTTQSASGNTDSANYASFDEMLAAYQADIAEIEAGDACGNNIVELYNPMNYIGAEGTNNPTWARILMGASEGDISMFNSLNLQLAWLNADIDAEIEWQWNGGHVPSEIFGDSLALYVDTMYGKHVDGAVQVSKAAATGQTANGTATEATGTDLSSWVSYDSTNGITMTLAGAANYRTSGASKAIPGFDVMDYGQEDYVFGSSTADARHWNKYVLKVFEESPAIVYYLHINQPGAHFTQARDHDNLAVKEVLDTLTEILNRHDNGPDCSLIFYSEMAQEGKLFTYLIVSPQDAATLSKPDAFALLRHKFRLRI